MNSIITNAYPVLSELIGDEGVSARVDAVIAACAGKADPIRCLFNETHTDYDTVRGPLDLLVYHLCCEPVAAAGCVVARNINADLVQLRRVLSMDQLRSAYRAKLINNAQFMDVVYEIAVAGVASLYLDNSSLSLENPLPDSAKNPDVTGTRNGQRYRIETTVLHETIPSDGVQTRSMMDKHEWEDHPTNPAGSLTMDEILRKDPAHKGTPVSKKLRDTIRTKTRQCETGAINIVVVGVDLPMFDRDLEASLIGAPYVVVDTDNDRAAVSQQLARTSSGPFIPPSQSKDISQFIDPFRILSGVWRLRLTSVHPASDLTLNPNAAMPITTEDSRLLESLGLDRARRG
jgi:hypothetical protein